MGIKHFFKWFCNNFGDNVMNIKLEETLDFDSLLIDLNDNEKEGIKRFSQGEALFVCGNRRMQINVIVTEDELESFGSGGGL